jgi:O-antigen ligase
MAKKIVYNPITNSLILLLFAQSFNDWWSLTFGLPTPVQLVIAGSIWYNFRHFVGATQNDLTIKKIRLYLRWYLFVVIIYWLILSTKGGGIFLQGISTVTDLVWVLTAMPLLSKGFNRFDWERLSKFALIIIGVITIPPGFYELVTHTNILDTKFGISDNFFYLRGLHIDKLEFGAFLSLGVFISLGRMLFEGKKISFWGKVYQTYVFAFGVVLISFSFSTTSIVGMVTGVIMLFIISKKIKYILPVGVAALSIAIVIKSNSLYSSFEDAYNLKYTQNVTNADDANFRYKALQVSATEFLNEPIFGYGMGQSAAVVNNKLRMGKDVNAHNFFANELLDYGLFGTVPLALALINVFIVVFKKKLKTDDTSLDQFRAVTIAFSTFMLFRLMLYYHEFNQSLYLVWISLAILQYMSIKKIYLNEGINMRKAFRQGRGRDAGVPVSA